MQNKQEVANAIFESIDVIVDKKLESLDFDKTVIAEVIKNNNDGSYQVTYQGTKFIAYSIAGQSYEIKTSVYVLLPNNTTERHSFILGATGANASLSTSYSNYNLTREIDLLRQQQNLLINALQSALNGNAEEAINILNEIKGG